MGKGLLNKLKLGFVVIPLAFLDLNSVKAQANENFDFLNYRFKYAPKYNTIAHKMLQIEDSTLLNYISSSEKRFYYPELGAFPSLKTLDSLVDNSKNYIRKKENYTKEEINEISKDIYSEIIKIFPDIKKERGEIDLCYRTSLIYLAIGEENKIPFYASLLPGTPDHIFIRYDPDGQHDPLNQNNSVNERDINIESTTGEIGNSDDYFINKKCLSKESLEKNPWLKNLNEKELIGLAYLARAPRDRKYDPPQTFEDCKKAAELFPNYYLIHWINAKTLEDVKSWTPNPNDPRRNEKAALYYQKALELNPKPNIFADRAHYYSWNLKNYKRAIQDYTSALNLIAKEQKECEEARYLSQIEVDCIFKRKSAYEEIGDYENAQKDFETWIKFHLGPMVKVPNIYKKENASKK
ncbi:MAG: hypothetical protein QT10_C0017G0002 [archaeon GW2011_AR19]|nr:MAG: hypothetical protein QT10_C0017G0002 [archaeon GW2011_AR19]